MGDLPRSPLFLTSDKVPEKTALDNLHLTSLHLIVPTKNVRYFYSILQSGFMVETDCGSSIRTFLESLPGIDQSYADDRIKTIFLDGKVIDDLETAFLENNSILALSAAMPGLVGATLRRGGKLASFRSQITFLPKKKSGPPRKGLIFTKLFNLILKELGPVFLDQGILLKPVDMADFIKGLPDEFWGGLKQIQINGRIEETGHLRRLDWSGFSGMVELKVNFVS